MRTILHQNCCSLSFITVYLGATLILSSLFCYTSLIAANTKSRLQNQSITFTDSVRNFIQLSNDTLQGNPQIALNYALKAAELLPDTANEILQAELNRALGASYTEVGDYGKAITALRKSAKLFLSNQEQQKYAGSMNYLGVAYDYLGDYDEALNCYFASLNALDTSNACGLIFAHNNIALIYMSDKAYVRAKASLLTAIQTAIHNQQEEYLTYPYHNLGDLYAMQLQLDSALHYYKLSYEIDLSQGDQEGLGINHQSMGEVYAQLGMPDRAFSHLEKALKIHESQADRLNMSTTLISFSELLYSTQQIDQAIATAKEALYYAKPIQAKLQIKDAAAILGKIYKEAGDYQQALHYNEMYYDHKDSLFNEAKSKKLALLRLKQSEAEKELLETDNELKKARMDDQQVLIEKQTYLVIFILFGLIICVIILVSLNNANRDRQLAYEYLSAQNNDIEQIITKLQNFNHDIEAQKKTLENSNKIKDKLISIISHDFRSPLNSLEGILDLMSQGRISSDEMKIIASDLRVKVNITTSLLDNLLNWAKNQMQGIKPDPKTFDIKKLVEETTNLVALQASNKGVEVNIEIDKSADVSADLEMIQLVLRNLLNNAIKFTNRGDQIIISAQQQANSVILSVKDTGIGMGEEQLNLIFTDAYNSRLGTSYEKGTGLGLMLCKDFVEKNGGKISVESKEGQGSNFFFTIPLASSTNADGSIIKNELTLQSNKHSF